MIRLLVNVWQLALLLTVVGGGAVAWTYYRSDEMLRTEILKQLTDALPDAEISLERANFDLRGRVRLFDLSISLPDEDQPLLTVAETLIAVDGQLLSEKQQVVIQSVHLSQPHLRLVRRPDGMWNWQELTLVRKPGPMQLPDLDLTYGSIELVLADHATRTMVNVPVQEIRLSATPSSQASYSVQVTAETDYTGRVKLQGELPLDAAPWSVQAVAERLRISPLTTRLAVIAAPQLRSKLEELQYRLLSLAPGGGAAPVALPGKDVYDLGCELTGAVHVQVRQGPPETPLAVNGLMTIEDGQVSHPILPAPLFGLRGKLQYDGAQVRVQDLSARTGGSQLILQAAIARAGGWTLHLQADSVPVDEPLVARLPEAMQKHVRAMELTGMMTGQIQVQKLDAGKPRVDAEATLTNGSVRHEKFPYPVREVTATATWHHDAVQIQAEGMGGVTPVKLIGTINNPGPDSDAAFDIRVKNLTMDDALRAALPESVRTVVNAIEFQGRGDAWVRLLKPPGQDEKYHCQLMANVREGTVRYRDFAYPVTQLSGRLKWEDDLVVFEQVRGQHDGAVITGDGRFLLKPEPGLLTLNLQSVNTAFDHALFAALPANLQEVWNSFAPQGTFNVAAKVAWAPGRPVRVDVPKLQITNANIQMRDFPFPFRDVEGHFAYQSDQQRVDIHEFVARHDDTQVSGSGFVLHREDGTATLRLEKFHVDDLAPTPALRRALPEALRLTAESLNPTGSYSFHGPVTFFADERHNGLTGAEWDLQLLLAGCAINAGLRVDNVHGRVHLKGNWTPRTTQLEGQLDLDALDVLGNHQITRVRGPIRLQDGVLVAGSAAMANSSRGSVVSRVASSERITGEAFDGQVTLDAIVDVNREPEYTAVAELTGGSLEKYAMRHLRGYSSVRGLMNGWMDVRGKGTSMRGLTGDGQLQISPAALYELPVFLQIFQLPQFAPNSRAAFDYANFLFRIENERFNFNAIDLVGNAISLRGRGVIRFDGAVMLDFYSMQPRNQIRIPGLREIVGVVNLMSQGWVAIEVRGPIGAPVARVVPLPAVDEALQQFLGAFNPRNLAPPPIPWREPPRTTFAPGSSPQ